MMASYGIQYFYGLLLAPIAAVSFCVVYGAKDIAESGKMIS
jgi:hypothetical protein